MTQLLLKQHDKCRDYHVILMAKEGKKGFTEYPSNLGQIECSVKLLSNNNVKGGLHGLKYLCFHLDRG